MRRSRPSAVPSGRPRGQTEMDSHFAMCNEHTPLEALYGQRITMWLGGTWQYGNATEDTYCESMLLC